MQAMFKMLASGNDEESERMLQWVEKGEMTAMQLALICRCEISKQYKLSPCTGVYQAFKASFLKTLFFGIAEDAEGNALLEASLLLSSLWYRNANLCT